MPAVNPYLQVNGLTKSFGSLLLFRNISFGIAEGQRVALIAKNGTGKSTLLQILAGHEDYNGGSITYRNNLKIGYLEQTPQFNPRLTVMEVCSQHADPVKAKQMLGKLDIHQTDTPIAQLSGGQLKRVALANVLVEEPDFLILDEPTNHLDLTTVEWLEDYLRKGNRTLLMVTHDRYFLDRVCTGIYEIDNHQLYAYEGNYSYYLGKKQERTDALQTQVARASNLYRTELEWMRRMPQARGHKARYREEAFYELEKVAHQRVAGSQVQIDTNGTYIGKKIFEVEGLSKRYADKVILNHFSYVFSRYEKMGIVGQNGTGKTTFLKLLQGIVPPDEGIVDVGATVRFGYYSQEGLQFDMHKKVIDVVTDIAEYIAYPDGRRVSAMQMLQKFLFQPERQHDYVAKLSGGEQRRLYLCTVLMRNPNFLILDEPTNDLDILTLQILEDYLQQFKGCLIVVSHDRYFMDKVVDHLLVFNGQGDIRDFPGNYTEYRGWLDAKQQAMREAQRTEPRTDNAAKPHGNASRKPRMSYKERQEFAQLEQDINALEEEKKQIEEALCGGLTDVQAITQLSRRLPQLVEELDEKSMRWLELSELEA